MARPAVCARAFARARSRSIAHSCNRKPCVHSPQVVKGMSELAMGLKSMHAKSIYWRDCKVDNVVLVNDRCGSGRGRAGADGGRRELRVSVDKESSLGIVRARASGMPERDTRA